jgi:DNA-binding protein H-NS
LRKYDLHHFLSANRFWEKTVALKTMPIDKLVKLRDQIEAALASKVTEQRRALESELSKLGGFSGGPRQAKGGRGGARSSVAPKYRNPDHPSETWAGRGLKPRWLAAAIKGGKKLEDFAIADAVAKITKPGRKMRKAKKAAKK